MPGGWLWKWALGELRLLAGFVAAEILVLILVREKLYRGMDCAMMVSIADFVGAEWSRLSPKKYEFKFKIPPADAVDDYDGIDYRAADEGLATSSTLRRVIVHIKESLRRRCRLPRSLS